ncbi:sugar ABC transporter ATP-binding protein [Truepera radiovictrix]|uniref:ABC transporter related protein n=1 Tax=Truepera radiovictrix (strain DSM 17093 / CIP 108686 / LMG 22925 / RQ-24) TaxID=649638 RepID=D7CSI5_TRURR|nr:sugar ABC transporter ATP-binding protein [Truepera radiovictrix]ADI15405.1 ABC transporter related protein [Truepera radiovictrix DSM 17093]WMT56044.1 sugar ABC transporter ATP-binding protein [Truepera radiovictrix]
MSTLLELQDIDKRFPGTHALKGVSLVFERGKTHAIVGENGAGKSTLIKILTGAHPKDGGTLIWEGSPLELRSPLDAQALGINAVHQEVALAPALTVAENIFLGDEPTRAGLVQDRVMTRRAQALLDDLGFQLSARRRLGDLTIGQQQLVATARASARGTKLLIFDEPTAYLSNSEVRGLFRLIRRLQGEGVTIVYISHRLEEIFELADFVTVLRDGAVISSRPIHETDRSTLIRDMAGRSFEQLYYKEAVPKGEVLLRTARLSGVGFHDISLTVRRGEIIGLFGLIGAGRSEFLSAVFGRTRPTSGEMRFRGAPYRPKSVADALKRGVALIPESRRLQGLCLSLSVGFNLNLPVYERISPFGVVRRADELRNAEAQIRDLRIRTPGAARQVGKLSGGNQQKVVLGKWLLHGAELYIFDEPTTGVDVATKLEIYKLMAALLKGGAGIILVSSYLPEVLELSDTLHVFRHGRLVGTHPHGAADSETILAQALGAAQTQALKAEAPATEEAL